MGPGHSLAGTLQLAIRQGTRAEHVELLKQAEHAGFAAATEQLDRQDCGSMPEQHAVIRPQAVLQSVPPLDPPEPPPVFPHGPPEQVPLN